MFAMFGLLLASPIIFIFMFINFPIIVHHKLKETNLNNTLIKVISVFIGVLHIPVLLTFLSPIFGMIFNLVHSIL